MKETNDYDDTIQEIIDTLYKIIDENIKQNKFDVVISTTDSFIIDEERKNNEFM